MLVDDSCGFCWTGHRPHVSAHFSRVFEHFFAFFGHAPAVHRPLRFFLPQLFLNAFGFEQLSFLPANADAQRVARTRSTTLLPARMMPAPRPAALFRDGRLFGAAPRGFAPPVKAPFCVTL